jgi:beta-barrel assembly-enhancing protease
MGNRWKYTVAAALLTVPLAGWSLDGQANGTPAAGSPPQSTTTPPQSTPPSSPGATTPQTTPQATPLPPTDPTADTSTPPATTTPAAKGSTQPTVAPGQTVPGIKPGSQADINAVGNRDIGARGVGNWYSTESEIKMGKGYAMELEKSTRLINDPVVTEYINRIGQNLVKNSDAKVPFTIKVIDSDEVNAMALPGGFFYVNSGLVLAADEEAELAGVMAHEIAHVAAHHAAREQTRANYAQLGSIPLMFVGGWLGYGLYEAASIGVPITFLHFSREFESQADYLGVQYMYHAGYDPQAFISFFEKIQNLEKQKPGAVAKAFSTHPQTPDRIAHTQEEINKILPTKDEYVVTTSEFDDVKARLARIENKRKLNDKKGGQAPTLRRASTTPSSTSSTDPSQTGGDDAPTLQRRDN